MKLVYSKLTLFVFLIFFVLQGVDVFTAPFTAHARELHITASVYPISLLLKSICQSVPDIKISLLLPAGTGCPHDYALTASERKILADTDILVINGLGLEEFLPDVSTLKKMSPQLKVVDASKNIGELLSVEYNKESHHNYYNPHIFASPHMMANMTISIVDQLSEIDQKNSLYYKKNGKHTVTFLENLSFSLKKIVAEPIGIIAQHTIFDYLARDLGLKVKAHIQKFEGQEPSASDMIALTKHAKAEKISLVVTEPQYPLRTGQTLAKEIGVPCITLDPLATGPANADLLYYAKIMTKNAEILNSVIKK